jgi:hypothetical protein
VSASVEGLSGGVNENGTAGAEDGQAWSGRVSAHAADRHVVLARCGERVSCARAMRLPDLVRLPRGEAMGLERAFSREAKPWVHFP